MFKEFIRAVIVMLENLHNTLTDAYEETYGCEEFAEEFANELQVRKRKNKAEFIFKTMKQVTQDILKKDGYLIPMSTAAVIAERLFKEAKQNNDIDELNNLIIKED